MKVIDWSVNTIEICSGRVIEACYPCSMVSMETSTGQISIRIDGRRKVLPPSKVSFNPILEGRKNEQCC